MDISNHFQSLYKTFDQACKANTKYNREYFYDIAGYCIRLFFANEALIPYFTPAIAHRRIDNVEKVDLNVCLWDTFSTGVPAAPSPWTKDDYIARGEIQNFDYESTIKYSFDLGGGGLSALDSASNTAIYWIHHFSHVRDYEQGAPLRTILYWWLRDRNHQMLHAAAVGSENGGVLLVGKGGSGKSTTALACLANSFCYVSDDYCLLRIADSHAYSVYNTGKLTTKSQQLLPIFDNVEHIEGEKRLFFLSKQFADQLARSIPIRAIIFPRIAGDAPARLHPLSSAKALIALAPSSIFQMPGAGAKDFQHMVKLVKKVPCFSLDLNKDPKQATIVIKDLLETL